VIGAPSGLAVWASGLVIIGALGLYVTFLLMRRSVQRLHETKKDLR
jgi:hypothetical protein